MLRNNIKILDFLSLKEDVSLRVLRDAYQDRSENT